MGNKNVKGDKGTSSGSGSFVLAAKKGDMATVKKMLSKDCDIDERDVNVYISLNMIQFINLN